MSRATVWVLRDGEPVELNVRTGLSNSEHSELVTDELQAGDEVIVRALVVSS